MHSIAHSNESLTDNLFMCLSLYLSIIHTLCISSQVCFAGYAYHTYVHCTVHCVAQYLTAQYVPHSLACCPSGHRNSCSTPDHCLMQRVMGHMNTQTHTVQLREHTYVCRSMYTCNHIYASMKGDKHKM